MEDVSLNVNDIADAVKLIDHAATEPGIYKGWVIIRQILAIRDRLEAFSIAAAASEDVTLNVTDIADAVKIIDHLAEQAVIKGWNNIRQAMAVRDRLDAFFIAANAQINTATPVLD